MSWWDSIVEWWEGDDSSITEEDSSDVMEGYYDGQESLDATFADWEAGVAEDAEMHSGEWDG